MPAIQYEDYVEWDITTWARAFKLWERTVDEKKLQLGLGLELGARGGGGTLFFAEKFNASIYCTNYLKTPEAAVDLHKNKAVDHLIRYYEGVDARAIPFEDNTFDFVFFKSILGDVGRDDNLEDQRKAINEIYRVLKPGGAFFFAENAKASPLHQWVRKLFVDWQDYWRYITEKEARGLLSNFSSSTIKSTGFLSIFVPNKFKRLKELAAHVDETLFFVPNGWKYVIYGYAIK